MNEVAPPLSTRRLMWAMEMGVKYKDLAKRLGIAPPRFSQIMSQGVAPQRHVDALRLLGMPEDLLPAPSREKPGPMSAAERAENAAR
ncbi:MAG: XRE family transcriptional regulator [Desulfovibrionaceae bacterium]